MPDASLPVAVIAAYDLWLWIDARLVDFPVWTRHALGRRLGDTAIDVLEGLTAATYARRGSRDSIAALARANQRLALLRLLLRGARDRRYLSVSQHEHTIERTAELGRMIGGWLRAAAKDPAP